MWVSKAYILDSYYLLKLFLFFSQNELSQCTTKPTIRHVVCPESLLIACAFYSLQAIQRGINENPCCTGRICRLIWVFAGYTGLIVGCWPQEVEGSTIAGSATFFSRDWSQVFSTVILSLPLIQEGQLSVSGKRMCTKLVNDLQDKGCPVNVWLGKLTMFDMTPLGLLGRKTSTQMN